MQLLKDQILLMGIAENIYVVGSISQLANWNPNNAIALSPNNYPTWTGKLVLDIPVAPLMNTGSNFVAPGGHDVPI